MMPRLFFALLLLPVAGLAAAALPIEFNGLITTGGKTKVALLNPNTGTAKWVAIGGRFESYTVTRYIPDPKGGDVVILTQAGGSQAVRLVLKNSYISESPRPQLVMTTEEVNAVMDNLSKIREAASQYFLEHGVTTVRFDQLPEEITKSIVPVLREKYSDLVLTKSVRVEFNVPGRSNKISMNPP